MNNIYLVEIFSGEGITFESCPIHIASTLEKAKAFAENYEDAILVFKSFDPGTWWSRIDSETKINIKLVEIDGKI